MRIMTVHRSASLQVNGTGQGPSLLTVMAGEGRCKIDGAEVTLRPTLDLKHRRPFLARLAALGATFDPPPLTFVVIM